MYNLCRHMMPSGARCQSPALRGAIYCYFHNNLHAHGNPSAASRTEILQLINIEDTRGIQLALTQILHCLGDTRLDSRRAGLYLYALQIAAQLTQQDTTPEPLQIVRETSCDLEGQRTAPERVRCDPGLDCDTCAKREKCYLPDGINYRSVKRIYEQMAEGHNQMDRADRQRPEQKEKAADAPKQWSALSQVLLDSAGGEDPDTGD